MESIEVGQTVKWYAEYTNRYKQGTVVKILPTCLLVDTDFMYYEKGEKKFRESRSLISFNDIIY